VIRSFRSKALERYWFKADASKIRPDWVKRVRLVLPRAERPEQLDLPGLGFHALSGDMAGRFAVAVSRNWRITFGFEDGDALEVELEDYHG
jgi:proteic killer suppression protein